MWEFGDEKKEEDKDKSGEYCLGQDALEGYGCRTMPPWVLNATIKREEEKKKKINTELMH
jgi:hypothetical protein